MIFHLNSTNNAYTNINNKSNNNNNDEISNLNLGCDFKVDDDQEEKDKDYFSPVKLIIIGQGIFVVLFSASHTVLFSASKNATQ